MKPMGLSGFLSWFNERWPRRPTADWLRQVSDDLTRAYQVSYYILGDRDEAKRVAQRAMVGLKEARFRLRHKASRQGSYRFKKFRENRSQSNVMRVSLPDRLELAARLFALTTQFE